MAATMEDSNSNPYTQETSYSSSDNENTPKSSSGWEQQEDYIHKEKKDVEEGPEKSEMAIPEDGKKRSGEYELPPPPEY